MLMMRAPLSNSVAAHAESVAPVVTTSSTSTTCAPRSRSRALGEARNAPETLRRLSSGVNRVCVGGRARASHAIRDERDLPRVTRARARAAHSD